MELIPDDMLASLIPLLLSILLSGLIGFEREIKNHPAGLRTHILVGLGACLLMLLSLNGFSSFIESHQDTARVDPGRIPSYVISGIGFLGAGTILVQGGLSVKGLTTAASIWIVAGIGLVVGAGMYFEAIVTTLIVLIVLFTLNQLETKILHKQVETVLLTVNVEKSDQTFTEIYTLLNEQSLTILETKMENINEIESTYSFLLKETKTMNQTKLIEKLQLLKKIKKVSVVRKQL
ncbi:MgtC/SapB family protein [Halalkalibacter kiskunsagensis]|uniref:MgtC/SapB family protein n=1 Tax=Halalkalibacter kiskunsagensis TaxID=1548599 RepID=A0ABV6K797_9BACI